LTSYVLRPVTQTGGIIPTRTKSSVNKHTSFPIFKQFQQLCCMKWKKFWSQKGKLKQQS